MKIGKQIRIPSYYPPEDLERLEQLVKLTRISRAEYLREALQDLLKKHANTLRSGSKAKRAPG